MFADFMLDDYWLAAMDSALPHDFAFNEAISFMVYCSTQEEIDYFWERLSAAPEAEQCGWLKDKYRVSWQIVPADMDEMMQTGCKEQIARVTEALLRMKKFDIEALKRAYARGVEVGLPAPSVATIWINWIYIDQSSVPPLSEEVTTQINVKGMTCGGCAVSREESLDRRHSGRWTAIGGAHQQHRFTAESRKEFR